MTKKRTIAEAAYEELAITGYEFDLDPAELMFALRRMEMMLAQWDTQYTLDLAYVFSADILTIDPDDESGLVAGHIRPVVLKLALEISRAKGKTLPPALLADAAEAYNGLLMHTPPTALTPPDLPVGAGYKVTGLHSEYFQGE